MNTLEALLLTELSHMAELTIVDAPHLARHLAHALSCEQASSYDQVFSCKQEQTPPHTQTNPTSENIALFYPTEYEAAATLLHRIGYSPDAGQQSLTTLYLVAASFIGGNIADVYLMTSEMNRIMTLLPNPSQPFLEKFLHHMRLFFTRVFNGQQLNDGLNMVRASLAATNPQALELAHGVVDMVSEDLGVDITDDEEVYLALHTARLLDH